MNYCRDIFERILDIHDPECLQEVESVAVVRTFRKKEIVVRAGAIQAEIPFIIDGAFWGYFVEEDGKQLTDCVVDYYGYPVTAATSMEAFLAPSDICLEAMEESRAVCIPMQTIIDIVQKYQEVQVAMAKTIQFSWVFHRKLQRMNTMPLQQRYETFCEIYPELSKRMTRTAIAACLNVSLPALTRALNDKA